jgi:hypothetical protein
VLRAVGFADAGLPVAQPHLLGHIGRFYGLPGPASLHQYSSISQSWRPFRTWAAGSCGSPATASSAVAHVS